MNRLPKRPLYLLIVLLGLALFPTASTAAPTELVRYHGDGSSATGAALANAERCDVNGDGLDDAVVGAWFWDKAPLSNIGAAYVIPGTDSAKGGSLNNPAAAGAVRIDGPQIANAFVGFAVGCLGDVNGDGFDDIGISYYTAQKAYVVFGAEDFTAVDLGLLGSRGFEVRGNSGSGNVGYSLAPVGDLDGDGLDEFGVAEVVADTQGRTNNGRIWVVSGQDDIADVDLTDPAAGQIQLAVDGAYAEERLGVLSAVGDVNGDGKDDFLVGSYTSTPWGSSVAVPGSAAVIWGGTTGVVDLADLGGRGFRIFGPTRGRDRLGISVAGAGDVNGDGKADLLIGADGVYNAATGERNGSAFVVFGSASNETVYTSAPANDTVAPAAGPAVYTCDDDPGTGTCADPADLHGRGYRIAGAVSNDSTAYSVAGIGDVSGDGIPDLAIGAYGYDPVNPANPSATMTGAGAVWVVYGKADTDTQLLADLDEEAGYRIDGLAAGDRMGRQVAGLGDFDGNGAPDFVAGGDFASRPLSPGTPLSQAGEVILALNGPLATATGLEVTPEDQVAPGQSFDLTATAHRRAGSGSEVDAGTFRFTVDGNTINGCGAIPAGPGGATCADIRPGARGEHVFAAEYSGAGDHLASDG
ncbi:MAG: FG-GAP repeat protein, partial [Solirubrobacterales bacterium]|nr:FG-GAP repeat protein [Solirubrobacterales bacterium]